MQISLLEVIGSFALFFAIVTLIGWSIGVVKISFKIVKDEAKR